MGNAIAQQRKPTALERVMGCYRNPEAVTQRLQFAAQQFHLVSPATVAPQIPEGCSVALSSVFVDLAEETYDVGGGKHGLAKSALDRIAAAAGISWDARQSGRLDDGSDPHYCAFRAVGTMRHLDGTEVQLIGTKEMDLREGSAQVVAMWERYRRAKEEYDSGNSRKKYPPKEPTAQISEMRLHILAHAETKARLRAVRSIGIRTAYKPEELRKPFVIARLMWTGQSDDPELRRAFALRQADAMLGGVRSLYGDAGAAAPAAVALPSPRRQPPPPIGAGRSDEDDFSAEDAAALPVDGESVESPPAQARAARQTRQGGSRSRSNRAERPAREPGEEPAMRFGQNQGVPLSEAEERDLEWYVDAVRKSLDDPKKARFRADNEAHLADVEAEIARRRGEVPPDEEPGADEVPDFADDDAPAGQAEMKL